MLWKFTSHFASFTLDNSLSFVVVWLEIRMNLKFFLFILCTSGSQIWSAKPDHSACVKLD